MSDNSKPTILIVDDDMLQRLHLSDILENDYNVIEAKDGTEAVAEMNKLGEGISLVILDMNMPKMDGLEVLEVMNRQKWIDFIPVIVISADNSSDKMARAFELNATDYLERDYDPSLIRRRAHNAIMLYSKQKRLVDAVIHQIEERERSNALMVSILSHIVEFRNQESGLHVQNIRVITETLLRALAQKLPDAGIDQKYIATASMASALHDIGKISIPDEVLNKPGRLTDEEFQIIKRHPLIGADMLSSIPGVEDEPLVKTAYEIARWHHERYDGRGYPDGISGDDIPLSAQVVAVADVYDALTAKRVYKDAFSPEVALQMIMDGECGTFNPMLLECLQETAPQIQAQLDALQERGFGIETSEHIALEVAEHEDLESADMTLKMLEHERTKNQFFASLTKEIQFDYSFSPPLLILQDHGADMLGSDSTIPDPIEGGWLEQHMGKDEISELVELVHSATREDPVVSFETEFKFLSGMRWVSITMRVFWHEDGTLDSLIGKIIDIQDQHEETGRYRRSADFDPLTGLLRMESIIAFANEELQDTDDSFALMMIDVDGLKQVNEEHGSEAGDQILAFTAQRLAGTLRGDDLVARVEGDVFMVLARIGMGNQVVVKRLFDSLHASLGGLNASSSIGIAYTDTVGHDLDALMDAATAALEKAKRNGGNEYVIYEEELEPVTAKASE